MGKIIRRDSAGNKTWMADDVARYEVTGVDRNGKRFKIVTDSWPHARGINVWRGSKWLVRHDGRRELIQSVFN